MEEGRVKRPRIVKRLELPEIPEELRENIDSAYEDLRSKLPKKEPRLVAKVDSEAFLNEIQVSETPRVSKVDGNKLFKRELTNREKIQKAIHSKRNSRSNRGMSLVEQHIPKKEQKKLAKVYKSGGSVKELIDKLGEMGVDGSQIQNK